MIFTLNWLKKFLETEASVEQITDALVKIGLEVESCDDYSASHGVFVVAEILEAMPHPNADSLQKCKVNNGKEILDIVCGAKNARAGIKVVLAPIGAKIPANGMMIKESKIRGELSQGMLCSYSELGLPGNSDGIIELPLTYKVGNKFIEQHGLNDVVIDVSVATNRADCLGVYGIARELAAFGLGELKPISKPQINASLKSAVNVAIENENDCKYFAGRYIKNIENKESPDWLKNIFNMVGQKTISAVVDITNYINLSFARPLHAYDANKIQGNILTSKRAGEGSKFLALNDEEYTLSAKMTVIADSNEALALAGVIGGKNSSTEMQTKNIFLEAAIFPQETVIASGRNLNINSDSRHRFERFVDYEFTNTGLDLAALMINEICGGEISEMVSVGNDKYNLPEIILNIDSFESRIGYKIEIEKAKQILESLSFVVKTDGKTLKVTPSAWRHDVVIKEDVIEEIARLNDFANIPEIPLSDLNNIPSPALDERKRLHLIARKILANQGINEVLTWSFMNSKDAEIFGTIDNIKITNPISQELDVMRKSIIPNLLNIISNNEARSQFDMNIFELGTIFNGVEPKQQIQSLAFIRSGMVDRSHYMGLHKQNALDVKADLFLILDYLKLSENVRIDSEVPSYYHPAKSGRIFLGKETIAYFGELHPSVAKKISVKQNIAMAELFIDSLPIPKSKQGFKGALVLSEYQPVERRFSFIIDDKIKVNDMINEARKAEKSLIKEVKLFDYVTNLPILEKGEKIAGVSVLLQSDKETLTSEQIDSIYNNIIKNISSLGAKFREA